MKKRLSILSIILLLSITHAIASHIVGGEVTYTCNDGGNYTINVTIYEDCLSGLGSAIAEDNPAFLSVFDGDGNPVNAQIVPNPSDDSLASRALTGPSDYEPNKPYYVVLFSPRNPNANILVPTNFSNSCITNAPATCLRKKTFSVTFNLPANTSGYQIVYQRCCRNAAVINLLDPSDIGATYYCTIPPASIAPCNNSAVFKNFPPQIICINNPLVYDNSATDADGDSLSYEFCNTYEGGTNSNSNPVPPPPPYQPVTYRAPYSYSDPMNGFPPIQIDPVTGLITGTPNQIGRFVVTVCCNEWRNHEMINTVKREFQFVVTNCSKSVVANIPQYSSDFNTYIVDCNGYTVPFVNTSIGGFSYHWNFGTGNPADTSNAFEPTFTYKDTGNYVVSLVVNPGTTCSDSIARFVKVYPYFKASYSFSGLQCPDSLFSFTDHSTGTISPPDNWQWNFGDGTTTTIQNPTHTYSQGGVYNVTLISQNVNDCADTSLKQVLVETFRPFAGDDTIIVKGESIDYNATGGNQYTWTPAYQLSDTSIYNPVGYYPDTGHFAYNVHIVSPFGCVGNDSIYVWVVGQASYFIPTGFTPNGDGKNDVFKPIAIGYESINYFRVFNRWGQMVYNSTNIEDGWDGTYAGKPASMDTYYWEISLINRYGKEERSKGDITLIR